MAVRELDSPPGLTGLYAKAALGAVPLIGSRGRELPDTELVLQSAAIDRDHLADYDHVCGFTLRDELPATYPHMLAFPLSMKLMTAGDFPFALMGMVHVENRIEQLRPIAASETLSFRVWAADLRPHDRGTQFDLRAEASSGGDVVWKSASTYLHKEKGSSGDKDRDRSERSQPPEPKAIWTVPGDIGRRYAGVSGDRNPIHLRRLTAVAFGMPRPIAHGMWLKARCLAALEGHLPPAFEAHVSFKLPVFIPGKVSFASRRAGDATHFGLNDSNNEKPHLSGSVTPLV